MKYQVWGCLKVSVILEERKLVETDSWEAKRVECLKVGLQPVESERKYSGPLNNVSLNCVNPLIHEFFSANVLDIFLEVCDNLK